MTNTQPTTRRSTGRGLPYGVLSEVARRKGVAVTTADYRLFRAKDPEYLALAAEVVAERQDQERQVADLVERLGIATNTEAVEAAEAPAAGT